MFAARRPDYSPRVEMTPLIDVIFLLLTFFIYSQIVMVRADALPLSLVPVEGGQGPGAAEFQVISLDAQGGFLFNGEAVSPDALDDRLASLAADPTAPRLYVAVASAGELAVDRGPAVIELIQKIQAAGIEDVALVGPPPTRSGPGAPAPAPSLPQ